LVPEGELRLDSRMTYGSLGIHKRPGDFVGFIEEVRAAW
jgi:hypothetical protein